MKTTYSFLTTYSNRIDVKASNPINALRKLLDTSFGDSLTGAYLIYGKDGIDRTGFITTPDVLKELDKYKISRQKH